MLRCILASAIFLPFAAAAQNAPYAITVQPASISATEAMLDGAAMPRGQATTAWYEWGTDTNYGQQTIVTNIGNGSSVVRLRQTIVGLVEGTNYHFRLVASNLGGVTLGADQRFTTGKRVRGWGDDYYDQASNPGGWTNVVKIAPGDLHSVILKNDGTVGAWGYNAHGQANVPAGLGDVVAVGTGNTISIALRSNGTVKVWGNASTNLGSSLSNMIAIDPRGSLLLRDDGTIWNLSGLAGAPASASNVVMLAQGDSHYVALRIDGTVVAWGGFNTYGQLNIPAGLTNVVAIAAGRYHTVALRQDRTVVAWGWGVGGTNVPAGLGNVVSVTAGLNHSAALLADGSVVAWGAADLGQTNVPPGLTSVAAVAAGNRYNLVLADNQLPIALGQSVDGPADYDLVMALAGYDPNGDLLSFRITTLPAQGALYQCAGGVRGTLISAPDTPVSDPQGRVIFAPDAGEVGNPYASFDFVANDGVGDSASATQLIEIWRKPPSGITHSPTMVRQESAVLHGSVVPNFLPSSAWFEWGVTTNFGNATAPVNVVAGGRMRWLTNLLTGLSTNFTVHYRVVASNEAGITYGNRQIVSSRRNLFGWGRNSVGQLSQPMELGKAGGIAAGYEHSVAVRTDGTLFAFGWNADGQTNVPPGATNVAFPVAGDFYSGAVLASGQLLMWGGGYWGQTTPPAGLSNLVAVAGGWRHVLSLNSEGWVVAWGDNGYGQTNVPAGLSNVVAIAAGDFHSVALQANGRVIAWGYNGSQQTNVPASLTNVIAVSAGDYYSLALKADGTVVAWGDAYDVITPAGLTGGIAIAAGSYHASVLRHDDTIVSWGYNSYNQTNPPAAVRDITAMAGGAEFTLALANNAPQAFSQSVTGYPNHDLVITLAGSDALDPIGFRIGSLPVAGELYQYSGGARGPALANPNAAVSDAAGRIIFVPEPDALGSPYTALTYVATDGIADSASASAAIHVVLPPAPQLQGLATGTNGARTLNFTGHSNATYRVWASTNLQDWEVIGTGTSASPGSFLFTDLASTNYPWRFYRAGAP